MGSVYGILSNMEQGNHTLQGRHIIGARENLRAPNFFTAVILHLRGLAHGLLLGLHVYKGGEGALLGTWTLAVHVLALGSLRLAGIPLPLPLLVRLSRHFLRYTDGEQPTGRLVAKRWEKVFKNHHQKDYG